MELIEMFLDFGYQILSAITDSKNYSWNLSKIDT